MCCDDSLKNLSIFFVIRSSVPKVSFVDPRGSESPRQKIHDHGILPFYTKIPSQNYTAMRTTNIIWSCMPKIEVKANLLWWQLFRVMSSFDLKGDSCHSFWFTPRSKRANNTESITVLVTAMRLAVKTLFFSAWDSSNTDSKELKL